MLKPETLTTLLNVINTAGVVGVLCVAIWLGLNGTVVTSQQLSDCRMSRDYYLSQWVRAISPNAGPTGP